MSWKERLIKRKINGGSENCLVANADCLHCLSKSTVFDTFQGNRINDNKGLMVAIDIIGEEHYCLSCECKFVMNDGPWLGLELAAWYEAMRRGLPYSKVIEYTSFIKGRMSRMKDQSPDINCPICRKPMKSISYDSLSPAQRESRYICSCGAYITLQFALWEE